MGCGKTNVGGGAAYNSAVRSTHAASGGTVYTIPCGGIPKGFSLYVTLGGYWHIFYCDLQAGVLFYDGVKYASSLYVTVSGNNILLNVAATLSNVWDGFALGFN